MPRAKWTFMVFMAGDNSLSAAGDKDLSEMRQVGSTAEVNIVAELDNAGNAGTRRFHVQAGGSGERVEALGETDSGSPASLLDFVQWAARDYPAERYALILWSHGNGWEPTEMDRIARSVDARGYTEREAAERSASPLGQVFFRTTLERIFSLPSPADRAICTDDGSGHSLDTLELGRVMGQIVSALGQPVDLLGMDACLMSNLEVAYQLRAHARTIVASEESEPADGWPYDVVLRRLVDQPDLAPALLAGHIVQSYVQSYVDRKYSGPVTQSAFDLARVMSVVEPLDRLADALGARLPDEAKAVWDAQRKSARFWHSTLWDVGHFCAELAQRTSDPAVHQAAQEVQAVLRAGPDGFVIAEGHHGSTVAHCTGLTVYLLPPLSDLSRFYSELDFAQRQRWLPMLQAYHAA